MHILLFTLNSAYYLLGLTYLVVIVGALKKQWVSTGVLALLPILSYLVFLVGDHQYNLFYNDKPGYSEPLLLACVCIHLTISLLILYMGVRVVRLPYKK